MISTVLCYTMIQRMISSVLHDDTADDILVLHDDTADDIL